MTTYKAEKSAELVFTFPDHLNWEELDRQNVKLPERMKLVDLVIERDADRLLVEIKDPSHSRSPDHEREKYFKRLSDNSILTEDLTPKARDSYTFLHLMEQDDKPLIYIVLIGLDAFDSAKWKALLFGFKDRLLRHIRCEAYKPWKRKHIADCLVLSVDAWNRQFPDWPLSRIPRTPAT
jgi:hypothetical protein